MDPGWVEQLGMAGAAALVQAAGTEVWQLARARFTRLFGRGDRAREAIAGRRLDALAAEVAQAPPAQRDEVRRHLLPEWRTRLADLVEEDPTVADALRHLHDELMARLPTPQQQWVRVRNMTMNITASASAATAQGVAFGNMINHTTPGDPAGEQRPR